MAIPTAYTANIAQMRKDNPTTFGDDQSAFDWGKQFYGWNDAGTGSNSGTAATGATPAATPAWEQPLNYTIDAAPAYAGVTRQASTVAQPTLGAQPVYSGPGQANVGAFQMPTAEEAAQDAGYQFRIDQGRKAMEAGAAARGTVLGGRQLQALTQYGQDMASQEYANAYQRALGAYQTNRDTTYGNWDRNYNAAQADYARNLNERDARYAAGADTWARDAAERDAAYGAANTQAQLQYKPTYDTWTAQSLAEANKAGLSWDRAWQAELSRRDNAFRDRQLTADDSYRWGALNTDDRYRRDAMDLQNRQFLAELGAR